MPTVAQNHYANNRNKKLRKIVVGGIDYFWLVQWYEYGRNLRIFKGKKLFYNGYFYSRTELKPKEVRQLIESENERALVKERLDKR